MKATEEVCVTCSYCGLLILVPFRHGAVMPIAEAERGVRAHIPVLEGGDHACLSERHLRDRARRAPQ